MASTLCLQTRDDIRIKRGIVDSLPGGVTQNVKPDIQIADLVQLMRTTCLDVAESAANSDIQLANNTICVTRALKVDGAQKVERPEVEGLPADLTQAMRGKLLKYVEDPFGLTWHPAQECTLRALTRLGPFEQSEATLAKLSDDLFRRSAGMLPTDLGALLSYRVTLSEAGQFYYRRHSYLFETAVVVMGDGDHGFTPISTNRKLDHPLKLLSLTYLSDIIGIDPRRRPGGGFGYIYGLTFKVAGEGSNLTLGFGDLQSAAAWSTTITQLQYRGNAQELNPTETEEVVAFEAFAAIMQTFRWQLPLIAQPLGRVVYHGVVSVTSSMRADSFAQLVLFGNVLVFIQGSPADIKHHLLASRIVSIAKTSRNKVTLTYLTKYDDLCRIEEFCFEPTEPESDVATWLGMLYAFAPNASTDTSVHRKIRRIAQKHEQYEASTVAAERAEKVSVAGLAALHATSVPNELNISIAILPEFESDGFATHLVAHVLEDAFEKFNAHRVQARVVHSSINPAQTVRAIRFLLHLGFTHEGVRRRSVLHPTEGQWADVSVLAMLELDWVTRASVTPAKGTLWDEMFVRHQREREVLLKMEGSRELKRTRSMETVREMRSMNDGIPSASMVSPSVGCPTVMSDTASQVSVPTTTSSWDEISDSTSLQSGADKGFSALSISSADDAADEYEEWDLEEDYSDEDDDDEAESEPKK